MHRRVFEQRLAARKDRGYAKTSNISGLFVSAYVGTSFAHRFAEAITVADKHWNGKDILTEEHPRFVYYAAVESALNERLLVGSEGMVEFLMCFEIYFDRYQRWLGVEGTPSQDWISRIGSFSEMDLATQIKVFEELVSRVHLLQGRRGNKLLAELVPGFKLVYPASVLAEELIERDTMERPLHQNVWEAIVDLATEQLERQRTTAQPTAA